MNNELYHHGIDGQRWGKRNGPPYPLDREDHRRVVRSAEASEKRNLSYRKSRKYAKRMSDKDLNDTMDRLKREETYRRMVSKEKTDKQLAKDAKKLDRQLKRQQKKDEKKQKEIQQKQQAKQNQNKSSFLKDTTKDVLKIGATTLATKGFATLATKMFSTPIDELKDVTWTVTDSFGNRYTGKGSKAYEAAEKKWWNSGTKETKEEVKSSNTSKTNTSNFVDTGPVISRNTWETSLSTINDLEWWK